MRAIGGRHKSNLGPTLNLFDFDRYPPSVDNLSAGLTINGSTVYPQFRYNAKHAGSLIWKPGGYGEELSLQGAGTAPSYNQGSPLMGKNDDSVKFNGTGGAGASGRSYIATKPSSLLGNLGLDDVCWEWVGKLNFTMVSEMFRKEIGGDVGWEIYEDVGSLALLLVKPGATAGFGGWVLSADMFAHYMMFLNRDENK